MNSMKSPSEVKTEIKGLEGITPAAVVEEKLRKWFPSLESEKITALAKFHGELTLANRTLSLIPPHSVKNAEGLHVADAVLAARMIEPLLIAGAPLYEFGGGNGCPGIVFALLYPARKVIFIEKDQKKAEFILHVVKLLGLTNVTLEMKNFEELPASSVKNVVSRGFGTLTKAMMTARKPLATGGKYFQMKPDTWANELAAVSSQLFTFWSPSLIGVYKVPETSQSMALVLTEKIAD